MVTTMRTLRLTAPLLALLAACNLDAPKQYLVPDLRIVAIQATAGGGVTADLDLDVGDAFRNVTLTALVLNPLGRTPIELRWYACLPAMPGTLAPCEDPEVLVDPGALDATPGVFPLGSGLSVTVDLSSASAYAPALDLAKAMLLAAVASSPPLACQLYVPVPVVAVVTDGEVTEVAVKHVRTSWSSSLGPSLNGAYVLNENPAIDALQLDPTDEDACTGPTPLAGTLPAGESTVCAHPTDASFGPYNYCDVDGTRTLLKEELDWQWYLSAGEIAQAGFDGNAQANPIDLTAPAGSFTLWTIVRDGRGGASWVETPLDVVP
jgi:hypothetical protein